ncbi:MAG: class I SAM-dependent methyltransferase [Spirochaetes bacterium]|nr:class I SAM-dependent methyltransferase [Spirochaetota bacterium]
MHAIKTFSTAARTENTRPMSCPSCGSSRRGEIWRAEGFAFVRCRGCGLLRQDPQPVPEAVAARYDEAYLAYETGNHFRFRDLEFEAFRDAGIVLRPGSSFLDVGCATGALIARLRERGIETRGVEFCAETSRYARDVFGLDVFTGRLEDAPLADSRYDLVHAAHLIEHLNDPRSFLSRARRLIKPGGELVLTTPNEASFQGRLMKGHWRSAIRDHLYLFSPKTLKMLLDSEGFSVVRIATWGGWPAGMKPAFLKTSLDVAVKPVGLGDVMIVRSRVKVDPCHEHR